jgi:hypothetical protein
VQRGSQIEYRLLGCRLVCGIGVGFPVCFLCLFVLFVLFFFFFFFFFFFLNLNTEELKAAGNDLFKIGK